MGQHRFFKSLILLALFGKKKSLFLAQEGKIKFICHKKSLVFNILMRANFSENQEKKLHKNSPKRLIIHAILGCAERLVSHKTLAKFNKIW
jgi:hypothetical protein